MATRAPSRSPSPPAASRRLGLASDTAAAAITDTFTSRPGSLLVGKGLLGPAAGLQGPITITTTCGGTALPSFVIPAGTPAGLQQHFYDNIPAGNSSCTVTESADGTTSTVVVTVIGGSTHTAIVTASHRDTGPLHRPFHALPRGTGGDQKYHRHRGRHPGVDCHPGGLRTVDQPVRHPLSPANTPAGAISRSFNNIPAGSTCTVSELANGASERGPGHHDGKRAAGHHIVSRHGDRHRDQRSRRAGAPPRWSRCRWRILRWPRNPARHRCRSGYLTAPRRGVGRHRGRRRHGGSWGASPASQPQGPAGLGLAWSRGNIGKPWGEESR